MKTIIAACVLLLSTTALACAGETSDDATTTSPSAVTEGRPVRSASPGQIDDEPAFAKGREPSVREGVDVGEGAKAALAGERGTEIVGDALSPHHPRKIVMQKALDGDLRFGDFGSETVGDTTLRAGEVGGELPGFVGDEVDLDAPSAATIAAER